MSKVYSIACIYIGSVSTTWFGSRRSIEYNTSIQSKMINFDKNN